MDTKEKRCASESVVQIGDRIQEIGDREQYKLKCRSVLTLIEFEIPISLTFFTGGVDGKRNDFSGDKGTAKLEKIQ
jgi:hypothetical protein